MNQLGGAVEEGLQVKGGIEDLSHLRQVGYVGWFYAGIGGVNMCAWSGRLRGTVVAFEVRVMGRRWWRGSHGYRMESYRKQGSGSRDLGVRVHGKGGKSAPLGEVGKLAGSLLPRRLGLLF